ncbi:nucleotide exchange factor GrpE [Nocardioides sp.]|uniref:nucleotide exchange factor GrpE n=1 Tax=Nocardioides sp. TaxID=35761 RepID=UPI00356AE8F4
MSQEPRDADAPAGEEAAAQPTPSAGESAGESAGSDLRSQAGAEPTSEALEGELGEDLDRAAGDVARAAGDVAKAKDDVATLTNDLQRVQAEFLNYKRRVDRDRELIRENATYAALAPITEVLDTIDRAREHGPLEGGFLAVADQLERVVAGLGLTKFGAVGDPFNPALHEALSHIGEDPEVEVTTCKVIAKAGYRIGDRVVRAAQVLVVDPASTSPATGPASASDPGTEEAGTSQPEE